MRAVPGETGRAGGAPPPARMATALGGMGTPAAAAAAAARAAAAAALARRAWAAFDRGAFGSSSGAGRVAREEGRGRAAAAAAAASARAAGSAVAGVGVCWPGQAGGWELECVWGRAGVSEGGGEGAGGEHER